MTKSNVEIDICLSCKGIWFDKGELSQTYQHDNVPENLLETPNLSRDQVVCQACGVYNPRSNKKCATCGTILEFFCPVCRKQMEEVPLGNVLVDRCTNCKGIWLDGGELHLLFEEFKQRKREEMEQIRHEGGEVSEDLAAWSAIDMLDTLVWKPELVYKTGKSSASISELQEKKIEGVKTKAGTSFIESLFGIIRTKV